MSDLLDPDAMPQALHAILSSRQSDGRVIAGVNDDDCAVLPWGDSVMVATTDYVNASPIALELGVGDLTTVGRLAVAANLSDLAGTGAIPKCLLLSIMMSRDATTEDFLKIIHGAREQAQQCDVPIVGGDTKLGKSTAVNATAIGMAPSKDHLFLKFRARAGDYIWLSGEVGSTTAAVLGLSDCIYDSNWREWAVDVLCSPEIPLGRSSSLSALALCCAGTDISDGLGMDLSQMCSLSCVGATIETSQIPVHNCARQVAQHLRIPSWALAFGVGGDFQFLVSADGNAESELNALGFHRIGIITEDQAVTLRLEDGTSRPMPTGGHRDGRRLSFAEESRYLIEEVLRDLT